MYAIQLTFEYDVKSIVIPLLMVCFDKLNLNIGMNLLKYELML
jgi:hypothetical protein